MFAVRRSADSRSDAMQGGRASQASDGRGSPDPLLLVLCSVENRQVLPALPPASSLQLRGESLHFQSSFMESAYTLPPIKKDP